MSFLFSLLILGMSEWNYRETVDPITDMPLAMTTIGDRRSALAIGCTAGSKGHAVAVIIFPEYLGGYGDLELVSYRFDQSEPVTVRAIVNDKQAQINGQWRPREFVDQLKQSSKLVVQRIEDDGKVHTVSFDLPNSYEAVDRALAVCKPFE